jgi:hypothetical protein
MPDGRSAVTFASSWGRAVISAAIGFKGVDADEPDLVVVDPVVVVVPLPVAVVEPVVLSGVCLPVDGVE